MIIKYALVLGTLLCFVLSKSGQGFENFTNFNTSTSTSDHVNCGFVYNTSGFLIHLNSATAPKHDANVCEINALDPKIKVQSNSGTFPTIANGSTSPQGTNSTLFAAQYIGATQYKSYRILNYGTSELTVSNVSILGINPDDFTTTITPEPTIIPGTFSLLEIAFSPLAVGARHATVSIRNDDADENPYTFAIKGTGLCLTASYDIHPKSGPVGTIATITGSNFDASTVVHMNGISMLKAIINANTMEVTLANDAATGHILILNGIGCTSTIPFTIIDSQISGCEGSTTLSDLFISELTDATFGGLNYIEIYNGTGSTIALGDYTIGIYYNGEATPRNSVPLNSINLAHSATYVLAIGSLSASTTCPQYGGNGQLADQISGVVGINKKDNEHDMIRLLKHSGNVVVDQIGMYMDTTWMDATMITGDRGFNFRRLNTAALLPNPNFNLNDWNIIDWVGSGLQSCHTNDYSDIGFYDHSGGTPPKVALQPTAPLSKCDVAATLSVLGTEGLPYGIPLAYQWFYNAPETSHWVEIEADNAEYSGQQSPNLDLLSTINMDKYQYYAQIREDGASCYKATEAIQLHIQQTVWNGTTWNPTPPDSDTIVVLNDNYTTNAVSGGFTACSLVVNSGCTLNITDNQYVEIHNNVIVNGNSPSDHGEIIVETNGALVQRGDGALAGTFILKNTAKARVNKRTGLKQNWYDYTYWSAPVVNETIESVLSIASPSRRFYFEAINYEDHNGDNVDDNGDDWQLASGRMIPGVGYASTSNSSLSFPRTDSTTFNGTFNTGNIPVTIHTNTILTDNDWNFLGNPYPSAIDFKLLYQSNSDVISGAAYLWSQASPPSAHNPGNQALNFNAADYAIISVGSGNVAGGTKEIPSDYIPSGQGFFVIGVHSGGTLTFKNSMRMADNTSNTQFFRHSSSEIANKFWINLTSDNGIFSQILVAYVEGATNGFDGFMYDAERNASSGLKAMLYTQIPKIQKKYAIQGKTINSLNLDEEVLLGLYTAITQPTIYALSIGKMQGDFFEENTIFIKDNLLNRFHDLSTSDYTFTSPTGEFNDRFAIVFRNPSLSVSEAQIDANGLSIIEHKSGHVQFSVRNKSRITAIEIMDVLGRHLLSLKGNNASETYDLSTLSQAVYIAKVTLSNGQVLVKRTLKR